MRIWIILCIIALLFACNQGPCDYKEYAFKAEVIALQAYEEDGKTLFHIVTKFDNSSFSEEPQNMDELRQVKADTGFVRRNRIQIGNVYTGLVNERTSGNCEPYYISFDQKFRTE